jgi:hypothetical protein
MSNYNRVLNFKSLLDTWWLSPSTAVTSRKSTPRSGWCPKGLYGREWGMFVARLVVYERIDFLNLGRDFIKLEFRKLQNSVIFVFAPAYFPGQKALCLLWFGYCRTAMDKRVRLIQTLSPTSPSKQSRGFSRGLSCCYQLPPANHHPSGDVFRGQFLQNSPPRSPDPLNEGASNGMLESLHWQPKAALVFYDYEDWNQAVPLVLLGNLQHVERGLAIVVRKSSTAEPLRLPGEFFPLPFRPTYVVCGLRLHKSDASTHTNIPACRSMHTHIYGLGIHPTRLSTTRCTRRRLRSSVCKLIHGPL